MVQNGKPPKWHFQKNVLFPFEVPYKCIFLIWCMVEGSGNPLQCSCLEPGRLPSVGSHWVGHDWSDLAAAALPKASWCIGAAEEENGLWVLLPVNGKISLGGEWEEGETWGSLKLIFALYLEPKCQSKVDLASSHTSVADKVVWLQERQLSCWKLGFLNCRRGEAVSWFIQQIFV